MTAKTQTSSTPKKPVVATAPKTAAAPAKLPANRRVAAFKAHRTMLQTKLKGLRGKKQRAELLAKIAEFDRQIAEIAA